MGALDAARAKALACGDAAQQHGGRGPHPLPLFLHLAARECGGDAARLSRLLAAIGAYQRHEFRRPEPALATVAGLGSARIVDYGGAGRPVLFVPSLVNPPYVLDLVAGRSMLRWLAGAVRPLLLDWGAPGDAELRLSVGGYVTERLVPLLEALGEPVDLAGYCLGGTMALAAAGHSLVRRVVTIAAPWHFGGYSPDRRAELASCWKASRPLAEALGQVPMDLVQPGFWSLDPAAAIRKFEAFGRFPPGSEAASIFVALEDWANGGPPISLAAADECFEDFFGGDLPGRGGWRVGGGGVDPAAIRKPLLHVVSTSDRIVPAASAPPGGERLSLGAGHVGMVVGSGAKTGLWEPLAAWLTR